MATNLFRKAKSLYASTCNTFGTGDSETITPASVSGLPTDTEITLTFDRVDSSGTATPTKMERIIGVISGGNFVSRATTGRGADGTTDQAHTSPVVEYIPNAKDINDSVDGLLVEHGQTGAHDATKVAMLGGTQTFTGTKTLNGPVISGTVTGTYTLAGTPTFTSPTINTPTITTPVIRNFDGWIDANESWSYASASTINVPSGAVSKYSIGDKVKITQTTAKYFYIIAVADTLLTVTAGTDFTVAAAAITNNYYSHESTPIGFPDWFNYTSTLSWTAGTAPSGTPASVKNVFSIKGKTCTVNLAYVDFVAGSTVTSLTATLPFSHTAQYQTAYASVTAGAAVNPTIALLQNANIFITCTSVSATRLIASATYMF